jgi:hypothetical protein
LPLDKFQSLHPKSGIRSCANPDAFDTKFSFDNELAELSEPELDKLFRTLNRKLPCKAGRLELDGVNVFNDRTSGEVLHLATMAVVPNPSVFVFPTPSFVKAVR